MVEDGRMSERIPRVYASRREYAKGWDWISRVYTRDGFERVERFRDWRDALRWATLMASNGPDGIPPPAE